MWFTSSSGRIELKLTRDQAHTGYHQGACDDGVNYLKTVPAIRRQLNKIDAITLRVELREYGAWDETQLEDHEANLSRLVWLACGDIVDREGTK